MTAIDRIAERDISIFDAIRSQTSDADKRSLLAVQHAVAQRHGRYRYLEVGSHLGGSLQPHLLDDRCERIYSIDPRPPAQPDDRSPGYVVHYEDNSTERMLRLLADIGSGDLTKIETFECDASEVDPARIDAPHLLFIDGEHTHDAALSDWRVCHQLARSDATILFHDRGLIPRALDEVRRSLKADGERAVSIELDGRLFAVFFDRDLVRSDPYLSRQHRRYRRIVWQRRVWSILPNWMQPRGRRRRRQ